MSRPARPRAARLTRALLGTAAGVATASTALGLAAPAAQASEVGDRAVVLASREAGDPYVYGAAGPNSFDCSGLVLYVYQQLGISLPHNTTLQYNAMPHVSQSDKRPGDVLFFHDSSGHIYHDAIYAGGGLMWAAPHTGDVVKLQSVYTSSYYVGRPSGGSTSSSSSSSSTSVQPASSTSTTVQLGSHGSAVAAVQRALGITADGDFGPQTLSAVRSFQSRNGLDIDGVVGPQTRAALFDGASAQPASSSSSTSTPTLHQGSTGSAVVALQKLLGITADGEFGPQTRGAVISFQSREGLAIDGVVGPRTWAALKSSAA